MEKKAQQILKPFSENILMVQIYSCNKIYLFKINYTQVEATKRPKLKKIKQTKKNSAALFCSVSLLNIIMASAIFDQILFVLFLVFAPQKFPL